MESWGRISGLWRKFRDSGKSFGGEKMEKRSFVGES